MNYYDEIKNAIIEQLEEEEYKEIIKTEDKDEAYYELYDRFSADDYVTGNASGSYYMSSYKSRKHCYEFFRDVEEALEVFGYNAELEKFKVFVSLIEEGYLNIENMTLNYDLLDEVDNDEKDYVFYMFFDEEIETLDFEVLDVITRCYMLYSVLNDVLDAIID